LDELELFDVFKVGKQTFPNQLKEHLHVNQTNLNEEFSRHSRLFSVYATAHELALDVEARLKEELSRAYAVIDRAVREDGKMSAIKLSEKMVENTVITHPKYKEVLDNYLDAKRSASLLRAARDAMIHRRDMLIQLGANYRAEGMSEISIKQDTYKDVFKQSRK
jgi:hypothetical protein